MLIPQAVVVDAHRYRLHLVRSGLHTCYQVEWQRNYETLSSQRLRTQDGEVLEFLAFPPWESSARLFAEVGEAKRFVLRVLKARPTGGTGGGMAMRSLHHLRPLGN